MRSVLVYGIASLWGISVVGQMASQVFQFTWNVPTGLNEIGTAVVMWVLAKNHQANKDETKDAESDRPDVRPDSESGGGA